ncbi:hypothetical protein [Psychrobacter sp. A3]|uniref:hypothetical protein n=1 Tax=Psychrobacter sp. A3 TaxID=2992754 RepID=UPI00406D10AB
MIPKFLKKRIFKAPVTTDNAATDANPVTPKPYANAPINQLYRKLSGQMLDVAVKPKLLGELPEFDSDDQTLRFYVLQDYSRSNSILIDLQTQEHNLPTRRYYLFKAPKCQRQPTLAATIAFGLCGVTVSGAEGSASAGVYFVGTRARKRGLVI